ncbi:hypothetical protein LTR39_004142 [Cryomyces antarcticus]|nr:hypothetical protein LTR39_004142 [Cryomyces antarcticus]
MKSVWRRGGGKKRRRLPRVRRTGDDERTQFSGADEPGPTSIEWAWRVPPRVFRETFVVALEGAPFDFALGSVFCKTHQVSLLNRMAFVVQFAKASKEQQTSMAASQAFARQQNQQIESRRQEERRRQREYTRSSPHSETGGSGASMNTLEPPQPTMARC